MAHGKGNISQAVSKLIRGSQAKKQDKNIFKVDKVEFEKCRNDPEHFIRTYCYIIHPKRRRIKFDLYDFQAAALKRFKDHRLNTVLKSRQIGISTLIAAYIFWMMLFHQASIVLVMANKEKTAKNLLKKIRYMVVELEKEQRAKRCKNVLPWSWKKFLRGNVTRIQMPNNSEVLAEACTAEPGRSEGVSLLVIDEAGIIENFAEKWGGLGPIITEGGDCIMNSTPRGAVGKFYDTCIHSKMDDQFIQDFNVKATCSSDSVNGYNLMIMPYSIHPDRTAQWLEEECQRLGYNDRQRAEEFYAEFLASGETLVHPERIRELSALCVDPIRKEGIGDHVWIWEEPDELANYLLVADVAEGAGDDFSAFHIVKVETGDIVVEYKGKLGTHDYSGMLTEYGFRYNTAGVVIERTGPGGGVVEPMVHTLKYPNIYYTPITDDLANIKRSQKEKDRLPVNYFYDPNTDLYINGKPGWVTSSITRPQILNRMSSAIQDKSIMPRSVRFVEELKTFVFSSKQGRYEAAAGTNDDLVMSFAIMSYVYEIAIREWQLNQDYIGVMLSGTSKNVKKMPDHLGSHDLRAENPMAGQERVPTVKDQFKRQAGNYHRSLETYVGGKKMSLEKEFGFNV